MDAIQFATGTYEDYMKRYGDTSKFSSGTAALTAGGKTLKKQPMPSGSEGLQVVPVFLHTPINLMTGERLATPFPMPGTVQVAIVALKAVAKKNAAVMEALKEEFEEKFSTIDFNKDVATAEELELFRPWRRVIVYAATVMPVRRPESTFPNGQPVRVVGLRPNPDVPGEYLETPDSPLIFKLHRLESALIASHIKELKEANDKMGNAARNETDMATKVKALWSGRTISNPYSLGTSRVLYFPTDTNYDVIEDTKTSWKKDVGSLRRQEYYVKVNRYVLEAYDKILNSKYDRYINYLLVKYHVPTYEDSAKGDAAKAIARSGAASEDAINTQLMDFDVAYDAYRNDLAGWDESVMLSSVYDYRTMVDDTVASIFQNSIGHLRSAMENELIYKQYRDVIAVVDQGIADSLMESAMSGEAPRTVDYTEELKAMPTVSEDTPGYGGDDVDASDAETRKAFMEAMEQETPAPGSEDI